jgi:hypothetical protein
MKIIKRKARKTGEKKRSENCAAVSKVETQNNW